MNGKLVKVVRNSQRSYATPYKNLSRGINRTYMLHGVDGRWATIETMTKYGQRSGWLYNVLYQDLGVPQGKTLEDWL